MELLSSVHYIIKHNDNKDDPALVWEVLRKLKPYSGFGYEDVDSVIRELNDLQLV